MQAIEDLYVAFATNKRAQPISYCGHCIGDEEAAVLQRTPLRELTADHLERYTFKAMSTWGEESDFRHFLPRILELFAIGELTDGYLFRKTMSSVRYAEAQWPADEREAIDGFLFALWRHVLAVRKPPLEPTAVLEAAATPDHTIVPYLELLAEQTAEPGLVHLADLVVDVLLSGTEEPSHRETNEWIRTGVPQRMLDSALAVTTDPDAAGSYRESLRLLAFHHPD